MTFDDNIEIKPWYTQFWPWFLFGLPAIVVVACMVTIYLAVRSPLSLVDDNYYKEGLGINEDIAASEYAQQQNLSAKIRLSSERIQVDLNQEQTTELEAALIHPTDSRQDLRLKLERIGARRFEALLSQPLSTRGAQYRLRLNGLIDQQPWILNQLMPAVSERSDLHFSMPSTGQ